MLIVTAKVPRRKLALGAALAALVCCCAIALNLGSPMLAKEAATSTAPDSKGVRSNQDRLDYLSAYGWTVLEEAVATQELVIPAEMDESYDQYLTVQQEQGFHLDKYAGKRVKRYTYEITNYPSGETGVLANLLIYKNTVVGGEVLSPSRTAFCTA